MLKMSVTIVQNPIIPIIKILRTLSLSPCSSVGIATRDYNGSLGVLINNRVKEEKRLLFSNILRRIWMGTIWIENESRKATKDNIVFEVYGENNMSLAEKIANEISRELKTKVVIYLRSLDEKTESFMDDYG